MAGTVQSAEDIQRSPKPPRDDRSALEKSMSGHVDKFEMPADPPVEGGAPEVMLPDDFKLPKTLKDTHTLLEKVQAEQPTDGHSAAVKQAKIEALMSNLSVLGAGPETPVIKMAAFREITGAQSDHANELKLNLLAQSHPEVKALMDERDALKLKWKK